MDLHVDFGWMNRCIVRSRDLEQVFEIICIVRWYQKSIPEKLAFEIHQIQPTPSESTYSTNPLYNHPKLTDPLPINLRQPVSQFGPNP